MFGISSCFCKGCVWNVANNVAVKKYWSLERCGCDFKPNEKQFVLRINLSVSGQALTEISQLSGIFSLPLNQQAGNFTSALTNEWLKIYQIMKCKTAVKFYQCYSDSAEASLQCSTSVLCVGMKQLLYLATLIE